MYDQDLSVHPSPNCDTYFLFSPHHPIFRGIFIYFSFSTFLFFSNTSKNFLVVIYKLLTLAAVIRRGRTRDTPDAEAYRYSGSDMWQSHESRSIPGIHTSSEMVTKCWVKYNGHSKMSVGVCMKTKGGLLKSLVHIGFNLRVY